MRVSQIRAITNAEFIQMMEKCRPPTGWPSTIAIANSAGPDSTCLLFLLRRMIDAQHEKKHTSKGPVRPFDLPESILSLHVDHGLQSDAEKMASAASAAATKFKADHSSLRIPWGDPPFPPHPLPRDKGEGDGGDGVESLARTARYRLIFDAMVRRRSRRDNDDDDHDDSVRVLATGHHADDQVETVLMRLGSGSTALGLGGMRPVRRFGMALGKREGDFGWFGHEGLHRWIVRPLLDVSKDRILATCDLHGICYVLDRTNFQPDLTLRNAIRHVLASNEKNRRSAETSELAILPPAFADKIARVKTASEDLQTSIDLMASREDLNAAVRNASRNLSDIESRVSAYLSRFSVPAPPGTFILAADKLSMTATDPLIRLAMVLRMLRYISPHPWGSTRAQAGRRYQSLQRIVQRVWDPDPASGTRSRFEAGANVLWTPLRISRDGRLKYGQPRRGERFGWLASRAPPPRPCQSDFDRDISTKLSPSRRRAEVLYDNRFRITFRLEAIPPGDLVMTSIIQGSGRVLLVLGGRWLWPRVVWRREGEGDVTLACISAPELDWYEPAPGTRRNYSTSEKPQEVRPPWQDAVDFKFIRILDEP